MVDLPVVTTDTRRLEREHPSPTLIQKSNTERTYGSSVDAFFRGRRIIPRQCMKMARNREKHPSTRKTYVLK